MLTGDAPTRVAAVTGGGDRAPDVGSVTFTGLASEIEGSIASQVVSGIAGVQQRLGVLDAEEQRLVGALVARLGTHGTFRYALTRPGSAELRLVLAIQPGYERQDVFEGSERVSSVIRTPGRIVACTFQAGQPSCQEQGSPSGLAAAMAIEASPDEVDVAGAADRQVAGAAATCFTITRTVPDGPPIGERCYFGDGVLASALETDSGQTFELTDRSETVDASAFEIPA
jgi:hypothetical protein